MSEKETSTWKVWAWFAVEASGRTDSECHKTVWRGRRRYSWGSKSGGRTHITMGFYLVADATRLERSLEMFCSNDYEVESGSGGAWSLMPHQNKPT